MHQKPGCTKVPKNDFHTELTESSNLLFCVPTRLLSPINVSVESSIIVEKGSFEKFLLWFLYQNFDVRKRTEVCVLNHLGFQNHVSTLVEAWFLPSRSQSEKNNLSRRLGWKDVDLLPCNRNLMVRKLQNFLWTLADLDIITQFPRNFQVWFVASRFHSIFLELSQINRLKFSRFYLLHQKPGCTKVPKNGFHTELTESSNLLFCVATRLVSPINASVKSSIIIEKNRLRSF